MCNAVIPWRRVLLENGVEISSLFHSITEKKLRSPQHWRTSSFYGRSLMALKHKNELDMKAKLPIKRGA